jgi:hypothetical protein
VYQQVPRSAYRFPARPAHLDLPPVESANTVLDSRRRGANGTFEFVVPTGRSLDLITAAPGQLTIGCGRNQTDGVESWYYKNYDMTVGVTAGDLGTACPALAGHPTVTLTLVASDFTTPGWVVTETASDDSSAFTFPSLSPAGN